MRTRRFALGASLLSGLSILLSCPSAFGQSKWDVTGIWKDFRYVIKGFSVTMDVTITNQNVVTGEFDGFDSEGLPVTGSQVDDEINFYDDGVFAGGYFSGVVFSNGMAGGNRYPGELLMTDTGGTWHGYWLYGLETTNQIFSEFAAPSFITQPTSVVTNLGASVQFNAQAQGHPSPTYQWQFNEVNIIGATNATFLLPVTLPADSGGYRVVASNQLGTNASSVAQLSFLDMRCVPALFLFGAAGQALQIQSSTNQGASWLAVTNVVLTTNQPYLFLDYGGVTNTVKFFRAIPSSP